jgi:hypothetical protein
MPLTNETRTNIFNKLKKGLEKCSPPMVVKSDKPGVYEIIANKPMPYGYKKVIVPGMYFSSAVERKDMVSFYFFPCYSNPESFKSVAPTLLKCLKGKTCFNFKKEEQVDNKELAALLKKGMEIWKKMGYMK